MAGSVQLLETRHIVDGPNAGGQAAHGFRLKAQFQHFLDAFADALLNALLKGLFREIPALPTIRTWSPPI